MELSLYEQCRKKRLLMRFSIWIFSAALLYSAVCMPIFIWAQSDIILSEGIFLTIWQMVSTVVNCIYYWIAFAYMLYFVSRFTVANCKSFFAIFIASSFALYAVSLLSSGLLVGFEDFTLNDVWDILMYVAFDAIQMAIVTLIAWALLRHLQARSVRAYLFELTKNPKATLTMPQWLPFDRLFDRKNELMRASLFAAIIPAAGRLLSRLYYDIFFFGAPVGVADTVWMIFYYLADIALFVIGYLFIVLWLNRLDLCEDRRRDAYEKALEKKSARMH